MHKKAFIVVFCLLALCASAQNQGEFIIADSPTVTTSSLDEIRIEGYVPNFLKISLVFRSGQLSLARRLLSIRISCTYQQRTTRPSSKRR